MASIWDALFSQADYRTASPQGGYADLYANGLLGGRTDTPRSVDAMRSSQDFVPVLSDVLAFGEAGNALAKGDRKTAAIMAGAGLLGLVPGVGDALARPVMAAGRKGAELARRIEIDPNAMGSMGGNVRLGAGDWAREGMSVSELIAASRKRLADRDAAVSSAAMTDAPLRMKTDGGMNALVSRSPDVEGGWRITYMGEDGVPNGHVDASDKSSAVRRAMEDGFSAPATLPTPRTDAEAMAKQVLEMRAAGNAGDVTDDMMALADDPYMFDNTPIDAPMDEASRMQRKSEMNFGGTLYRGDKINDLQQFESGQFARSNIGVTASDNSDVASTYMTGSSPAIYPIAARSDNVLSVNANGRTWRGISADAEANKSTLDEILEPDSYLDDENLFDFFNGGDVDWGDGTSTSMSVSDTDSVSRAAQQSGFDQVRFENIVDRGGAGKYANANANMPHTTVMTSDPRNIRSQYARFDPAFKHLRNLSAGVAGVGLLSQADQRQQRRGLLE